MNKSHFNDDYWESIFESIMEGLLYQIQKEVFIIEEYARWNQEWKMLERWYNNPTMPHRDTAIT